MEGADRLTDEEKKLAEGLLDKKSAKRRAAAKKIGKLNLTSLSSKLLNAYLEERKDKRTWETQSEMIKALGRLRCSDALPVIKEIVQNNIEFDMITDSATIAYLRLIKQESNFMDIVMELLKNGKHSVHTGVIDMLIYDKIELTAAQMKKIIEIVNSIPDIEQRGVDNLKERAACLMALWPIEITRPYLEEYLLNPNVENIVVEHALKGKAYGPKEY